MFHPFIFTMKCLMMMLKVGDLCLCDGWRVVLVIEVDKDGISEDDVKVLWKSGEYWVGQNRLEKYPLPVSADTNE